MKVVGMLCRCGCVMSLSQPSGAGGEDKDEDIVRQDTSKVDDKHNHD